MSRTFNGTSDVITCAIGGVGAFGPATIACITRRNTPTTNNVFSAFFSAGTGTTWELLTEPSNGSPANGLAFAISGSVADSTIVSQTSDGWAVLAGTKATGTVGPRLHRVLMSTGVATHNTSSLTLANSGAPATSCYLGSSIASAGDFSKGDIYMLAVWNIVLTDAQIENLAYTKNAWFAPADPKGMWVLDQDAVTQSVRDLVGSSNQTARSGTTIATSAVTAWTYGS